MHWFDGSVMVLALLFGLWGLWRGLIREVMSLLGLGAAFVLAARGYSYVAPSLESTIGDAGLRHMVSSCLIFVGVLLAAMVLSRILRMMLSLVGLSLLDRLLGGVFGVVKITLIVAGLLIVGSNLAPTFTKKLGTEAALAPLFFQTAEVLSKVLAQQDYDTFKQLAEQALAPLQKWLPGPQSVPAVLEKLLPEVAPATSPALRSEPAPASPSVPVPFLETPPSLPSSPTQEPPPAAAPPPVVQHTPTPLTPSAPAATEGASGISEEDRHSLEKLLRERLKERKP